MNTSTSLHSTPLAATGDPIVNRHSALLNQVKKDRKGFQWRLCLLIVMSLFLAVGLTGQTRTNIVLSANDQSVEYRNNEMVFLEEPGVGSLTVLDFEQFPPATTTIENVPVTVIGPPTSVALVPGRSLAIVTSAMVTRKRDDAFEHYYDSRVALVDLRGSGQVLGVFDAGTQPSGVTVTPDGGKAYLANRAEGSLSMMVIGDETLTEGSRTKVAEADDSLSHVEIAPDGRYAVATLTGAGKVLILRLRNDGTPEVISQLEQRGQPYAARFLPDGSGFVVADIEGNTVTHYQFSVGRATRVAEFPVGRIPEGIDVSPDGDWIAVSCFDGGNLTDASHSKFGEPAKIYFLRKVGGEFRSAGEVEVEGTPQFAVFSPDGQHLAVSNTGKQRLSFLRKSEDGFTPADITHPLNGEPVAAVGSR